MEMKETNADTGPWNRDSQAGAQALGQETAAEGSGLPLITGTSRQLLNPVHFPQAWCGPRREGSDLDRTVTNCSVGPFLLENSLHFSQRCPSTE